jgi:chromosome segregation protein
LANQQLADAVKVLEEYIAKTQSIEAEAKRELARVEAAATSLQAREKGLIENVAVQNARLVAIRDQLTVLAAEYERLQATKAATLDSAAQAEQHLATIEKDIAQRKADTDTEVTEHRRKLLAALESVRREHEEVAHELRTTRALVEASKLSLADFERQIDALHKSLEVQEDEARTTTNALSQEVATLTQTRDGLVSEIDQRAEDLASLITEQADVYAKLQEYQKYETRSKRILETKEASLIAREQRITQAEITLQNRGALLPKI